MKRAGIDWEQVHKRLAASQLALEEALDESPGRIETVYRQRASRLAAVQMNPKSVLSGLPVLVLRLALERYAIELKDVTEVLPFAHCTRAPGTPAHYLGVINLRGEIRAVLDLGRLLTLSESENTGSGFVLMLRQPGHEVGLKVDSVEGVLEIRPEELTPPAQAKYTKGIASGGLMLLNVEELLAE